MVLVGVGRGGRAGGGGKGKVFESGYVWECDHTGGSSLPIVALKNL